MYIFGPVPSRRLGLSLGVDLVPSKVCPMDCVYCECGRTTLRTSVRKPWADPALVIAELKERLEVLPEPECVTFSGAGEPTLNSGIGEVIGFLKSRSPDSPVALLTNGALLEDEKVRKDISGVDIVIPTLSAVSQEVFERISRPEPGLTASGIVEGIRKLSRESSSRLWVEVFIVPGINDDPREVALIRETLLQIEPDKVHLNTLDRPASEPWVRPAPTERMEELRRYMRPLDTEIILPPKSMGAGKLRGSEMESGILELISRRPCTPEDISQVFGVSEKEAETYLQELLNSGRIFVEKRERGDFYKIK